MYPYPFQPARESSTFSSAYQYCTMLDNAVQAWYNSVRISDMSRVARSRPDEIQLQDLSLDGKNARRHTKRNLDQIERSLANYGAGRSILVDEQGRVLAGNGVVQAARAIGIRKVRVIEASKDELVAVRRSDLSEQQKLELSIADNRTAELAEWDAEILSNIPWETLSQFFHQDEFDRIKSLDVDFLNKMIAETSLNGSSADSSFMSEPENDDGMVKLIFLLLPGQRDVVLKKLKEVQEKHGLETLSAALYRLAGGK